MRRGWSPFSVLLLVVLQGAACGDSDGDGDGGGIGGSGGSGAGGAGGSGSGGGPACEVGLQQAWPGCEPAPMGDATLPAEGCYAACDQEGAACSSGGTCTKAWVNPCVCRGEESCCAACGAEALLCLP